MNILGSNILRRLGAIIAFMCFLSSFIPIFRFLYPLLAIVCAPRWKPRPNELPLITLILFLIGLGIFAFPDTLMYLRVIGFHFGFVILHQSLRSLGFKPNEKVFLYTLLFFIPLEAILVNTLLDPRTMPNYPVPIDPTHGTHIAADGVYQRPYSFGGNASVSSVVYAALLGSKAISLGNCILFSLPIFLTASFSGIIGFFIVILSKVCSSLRLKSLRFRKKSLLLLLSSIPIFLLLLLYSLSFLESLPDFLSSKVSFEYFLFLMQQKLERIMILDGTDFLVNLFGDFDSLKAGGDSSMINYIYSHGLLAFILLFIYIIPNLNSANIIQVTVIVFGSFHYHVIFSALGQLALAMFLLNSEKKLSYDAK